jgi:hypothetical protein
VQTTQWFQKSRARHQLGLGLLYSVEIVFPFSNRKAAIKGYQLKAEECGAERRTLPFNFFAFSGKPHKTASIPSEAEIEAV